MSPEEVRLKETADRVFNALGVTDFKPFLTDEFYALSRPQKAVELTKLLEAIENGDFVKAKPIGDSKGLKSNTGKLLP